jgi:hypothetical protein
MSLKEHGHAHASPCCRPVLGDLGFDDTSFVRGWTRVTTVRRPKNGANVGNATYGRALVGTGGRRCGSPLPPACLRRRDPFTFSLWHRSSSVSLGLDRGGPGIRGSLHVVNGHSQPGDWHAAAVMAADRIDDWIRRHVMQYWLHTASDFSPGELWPAQPAPSPSSAHVSGSHRRSRSNRLSESKSGLAWDSSGWLAAIGQGLRVQYDAVAAPMTPRLAALVEQVEMQHQQ